MTSYVNRRLGLGVNPSSYQLNTVGNILFSGAGAAAIVAKLTISGTVIGSGSTYGINLSTSFDASTTTNYGIYSKPTFTGTSAITNAYNLYIDNSTKAAGTITSATGVHIVQPTSATTNIGFNLTGTTTGANDINLQVSSTFTPTTNSAVLYAAKIAPNLTYASGASTTSTFYASAIVPTINITSASQSTYNNYYTIYANPSSVTLSGTNHTITTYYGIYSGSPSPTLANSSAITTAYSGYFAAPGLGTTKVALYTNDIRIGTLTDYAPLMADPTTKNVSSITTGFSNAGWVLTSNGSSAAPTWQASTGGVTSITGTANQVSVSPTTGAAVVSLPSTIIAPGTLQVTSYASIGASVNSQYGLYNNFSNASTSTTNYAAYYSNGTFTVATAVTNALLTAINIANSFVTNNASATLTLAANIYSTPTFTNTTATNFTNAASIYLASPTITGTVNNAYNIFNNVPVGATFNYGYYQTGTFTKANDVGMQLINTFTPTSSGVLYQLYSSPTFNTTSAIITNAYASAISPTFNCNSANNLTSSYGSSISPTINLSSSGTMTAVYCEYISPTINITTATTGTAINNIYGLFVSPAAPTITNASVIVSNYYGVYSGKMAAKTGSGNFTNAYGGYFVNPTTTATVTSSIALYATEASFGAANSTTNPPANGILVQGNILNQTLAISSLVGTDGSSNLTTTTSTINASLASLTLTNPLVVTSGGTGISSCALGDVFYGGGVNSVTPLPGNITSTKKFFNQTGTGVVSAAPQWSALVTSDLGTTMTPQFTAIGLGTPYSTEAFLITSARTAGAVSSTYHLLVTGITTGSSSSTTLAGIDVSTTNTASGGTLTNAVQLQLTPNTNATSNNITNSYGLLINAGSNGGGTVSNYYGISNTANSYAATNKGYYQSGTFTKANDVGLQLNNTFTPAATATNYSMLNNPTMAISSGTVAMTNFYAEQISPTVNITSATGGITFTGFYGLSVNPTSVTLSGAAHTLTTYCGIYSATPAATLAGGATITTAYSGYFAAPGFGTTKVALYANDITLGTATTFAPLAVDTNRNVVSLTTGISNVGYVLTSTGGSSLPTWQATSGGVTSVTGTANQVTASPTTGAVVVSLPSTIITPGTLQVSSYASIGASVNSLYGIYNNFSNASTGTSQYAGYYSNGTFTLATNVTNSMLRGLAVANTFVTNSATSTLSLAANIYSSPTFTNTTATSFSTAASLYLETPTMSGTILTAYGIYNSVPTGADTNYGYYSSGTFTKINDVGMYLINTFTPTTDNANPLQMQIRPTFNTTTNTISSATAVSIRPSFRVAGAFSFASSFALDIVASNTINAAATLSASYGIRVGTTASGSNATAITNAYNIYLNDMTVSGSAVISVGYGIFNSVPTGAGINRGYYQNGTFTKTSDVGMYLVNTFTPTSNSGTLSQLQVAPVFNTTTNTISDAYGIRINPTFTIAGANALSTAYGIDVSMSNTINAAATLSSSYGVRITTSINGSNATPVSAAYNLYLVGINTSGSATLSTGYGILNSVPTSATINYGYYQSGTMAKTGDIGMWLNNSFVPTSNGASPYQFYIQSTFSTATNTITTAYAEKIAATFLVGGANAFTNAFALDISVTDTINAAATLSASYGIRVGTVVNGSNATAVSQAFNLYLNGMTVSGSGALANGYGIYNSVPTDATQNYGYYQTGTFTKATDVGLQLSNSFTPTVAASSLYQLYNSPAFNTSSNTINTAYAEKISPTFTIGAANALSNAFGLDINITDTINAAAVLSTSYGLRIGTTANGSNATAIGSAYNLYLNGITTSGSAVITTGYGIYNSVPTGAATNYGHYQTGTFTKANDIGMLLSNIFTPTAGSGSQNQFYLAPTFSTISNTIINAYAANITSTFTIGAANSLTSAFGMDVNITDTINAAATLGSSYGIRIGTVANGSNSTAITNAYNLYLNGMTTSGSATISSGYGIYNSVPVGAVQNIGYYSVGTFTKTSDFGMYLNNSFIPTTDSGTLYQLFINPTFYTTTNTITSGYGARISATANIAGAFAMTNIVGLDVAVTDTINAAATLSNSYGIRVNTLANGSNATAITNAYNLYLNGITTAGSAVISTAHGIYNSVPNAASQNIGYRSFGTFTKFNDYGMVLINTFTPSVDSAILYQFQSIPTFNAFTNTISSAYGASINPTFTVAGAFAFNNAYGLDVVVTNTINAAATLGSTYGIRVGMVANGINATAITNAYNLYLNGITTAGSATITTAYGIYNSIPTGAVTNYGYYQTGTFTKITDVGFQLNNTFTPATTGATLYQSKINPTFNTGSSIAIATAYASQINPIFNVANTSGYTTGAYGVDVTVSNTFNAIATIVASAAININNSASGASAGTVTTMYGIIVNTLTKSGSAIVTTAYGGYFNTPTAGTTNVALYADNMAIGYSNTAPPANGAIISGSVGIGTNSASYKLDVTGDGRFTSSIGVGTTPSGVAGQISGTTAILTGTPSIYASTFSVYVPSTTNRLVYVNNGVTNFGYLAGVSSGVQSTSLGYQAGQTLTGVQNTCVGYQAGTGASTFDTNALTAVGYRAGYATTSGLHNTIIGSLAGQSVTSGWQNTLVGAYAGQVIDIGYYNTAVGYRSQYLGTSPYLCTSVGYYSLYTNTSGQNLTAVGSYAGFSANGSTALTAVGYQAGYSSTGGNCTYLGYNAGFNSTGSDCTYVGCSAGQRLTSGTQNTCVGSQAGYSSGGTHTAGDLTAVGFKAGYAITTGNQNTLIGSSAGAGLTSGGSNVMIGYQAGSAESTNSNRLYIANSSTSTPLIFGDFSTAKLTVYNYLGVAMSPTYALDITGQARISSYMAINGNTPDANIGLSIGTTFTATAIAAYGASISGTLAGQASAASPNLYGFSITSALVSGATQTGTVSHYGLSVIPTFTGSATTITAAYGLYARAGAVTGTVTTAYSGYFATPSGGTTKYALYTDDLKIASLTGYLYATAGVVSVGAGTTNRATGLNNAVGPAANWTYSYSSVGGAVEINVVFSAYVVPANINTQYTFAISVDGGAVQNFTYVFTAGNTYNLITINYVSAASLASGSHTIAITVPAGVSTDTNCFANMTIVQFA